MNVDLGIWDKLARMIVFLLLMAALLGIAIWYFPLIQRNERMRKEIHALDADIKRAEDENKRLKGSIEAMRDPRTIERLAREKLSYARTGETVIRFEAPLTNRSSSRPASNSN
jgi:cell division protein FtsB